MTAPEQGQKPSAGTPSRRQLLFGGVTAFGAGAVAALGIEHALPIRQATPEPVPLNGGETVAFYGAHQAGIDTDAPAHTTFIGLDLLPETDRDALRRMMRILTDDAVRLTQGETPLADSEPELGGSPARLTVTFGFGPEFVDRVAKTGPEWLHPLPAFGIDQLQPEFCDGDLLIQIGSDDPLTIAHASRMLLKDARSFASVRWTQAGFRRAHGTVKPGTTMRNLFGQVDGTNNPQPGTEDFDRVVWSQSDWLAGGTSVVVRRIKMDLDEWDRLDRSGRDQALGRFQSNGAPITSTPHGSAAEYDEPDFEAKNALGFTVIPEFSHIARARPFEEHERIFRRAYNYQLAPTGGELSDAGLLFVSYQADVDRQFTPMQKRLDELDLLNEWTTPVGSAVFAIPPGCAEGGYIGETLLA